MSDLPRCCTWSLRRPYLSNLDPPFYFYSEGTIAQTGRIDLIGCNGDVALAMEAKGFGPINSRSNSAFKDLQRLRDFVPAYSKPASPFEPRDWWQEAKQRWGLLLVMSFRGVEVKEAWEAPSTSEAYEIMQSYTSTSDRPADENSGFMALLQDPDMIRFGARIAHTTRWGKDTNGWLLCGAIPLPPHAPSSAAA